MVLVLTRGLTSAGVERRMRRGDSEIDSGDLRQLVGSLLLTRICKDFHIR